MLCSRGLQGSPRPQPPGSVAAGLDDGSAFMPLIPLFIPDSLSADANGSTATSAGASSGIDSGVGSAGSGMGSGGSGVGFGRFGLFRRLWRRLRRLGRRLARFRRSSGSVGAPRGPAWARAMIDGSSERGGARRWLGGARRRTVTRAGRQRTGRPRSARRAGSRARRSRPCTSASRSTRGATPRRAGRADPASIASFQLGRSASASVEVQVAARARPALTATRPAIPAPSAASHDLDGPEGRGRLRAPCLG